LKKERLLTSAVLGHPADVGRQAVDVEVAPVEGGALLLPEVFLLLGARLRVTGAELHPPAHAVRASIPGPRGRRGGEEEGNAPIFDLGVGCSSVGMSCIYIYIFINIYIFK